LGFRQGWTKIHFDYSELFYHPRISSPFYPIFLERLITKFPQIAKLFANQIHMKITPK